jgi:predicted outer membrane repeat protein
MSLSCTCGNEHCTNVAGNATGSSSSLYIDASDRVNDTGSLQNHLCSDLSSNIIVYLSSALQGHVLESFCLISNLTNVTITSDHISRPAHIYCPNDAEGGLKFHNVTGLALCNVNFNNCGGIIKSAPNHKSSRIYFSTTQQAVLVVSSCCKVTIVNINITGHYCGFGLIIDASYNLVVDHMILAHENNYNCSSSGLLLFYSNDMPSCIGSVQILHVHIENNWNDHDRVSVEDHFIVNSNDEIPIHSIASGGITIHLLNGNSYPSEIYFNHTKVLYNHGGGVLIVYKLAPLVEIPVISFMYSYFGSNTLKSNNGAGMAIYLVSSLKINYFVPTYCIICIVKCAFANQILMLKNGSKATYGGGLYVSVLYNKSSVPFVLLDVVKFLWNTAIKGGLAIYVKGFSLIPNVHNTAADFIIILKNVLISNSHYNREKRHYFSSLTTTEFNKIKQVIFEGSTILEYNDGTGISISSTGSLKLKGRILIESNRGLKGGGIKIGSNSLLVISDESYASFVNNIAFTYGGAIYSETDDYCPISFTLSNFKNQTGYLEFANNKAFIEGDDMFLAGLKHCQHIKQNMIFNSNASNHKLLSTPPVSLSFCSNNYSEQLIIYPGFKLKINLSASDETASKVITPVSATFSITKNFRDPTLAWEFEPGQNIQLLSNHKCTILEYTILKKTSDHPMSGVIELAVLGQIPLLNISFSTRKCPLGFKYNQEICDCDEFLTSHSITKSCDINKQTILITGNTWLGYAYINYNTSTLHSQTSIPNGKTLLAYASSCPTGYCKNAIDGSHDLEFHIFDHSALCINQRTGILCGGCIENYTAVLGSFECIQCSFQNYLPIILFPLFAVVIIICLLTLNLTISNGILGSFIFYANVHIAMLQYQLGDEWYVQFTSFFINCLNFSFPIKTCLSTNLSSLTKTAVSFASPVFLWIIVLVLIIISKYSTKISNVIAHSSIQVLATLFYLSFAKLLLTVIDICTPAIIYIPSSRYLVWYTDGNISFWHNTGHVVLVIVAFFVTFLLLIPFIFFVTCGSLIFRLHSLRSIFIYVNPFVDAYQGPYREKCKYWSGLKLLLLLYIYGCFAALRGQCPLKMLGLQIVPLLIFTIILSFVKPYRSVTINIIDVIIHFCLLMTYTVKFYYIFIGKEQHSRVLSSSVDGIVIIFFFCMVGYHMMMVLKKIKCQEKLKMPLLKSRRQQRRGYEQLNDNSNACLREPTIEP